MGWQAMTPLRFGTPAALVLLALLPVVAAMARRRATPRLALALRLAALALMIVALAAPSLAVRGGDLSVVFAVDRSDSISAGQQAAAQEFVRSAAAHRRPGDHVGLVTFGANALIEELPGPHPQLAFTTQPEAGATDIGLAIRTAISALPPDGARRIVLLSDGNDNRGGWADALALAQSEKVDVSVVPLEAGRTREVLVDDVAAPAEVLPGEQFAVKVAVAATAPATVDLTVTDGADVIARRHLDLHPGRTIVTLPQVARTEGLLHYTASLSAAPDETDANNRADAVVLVRGAPVVWYAARQPGPLVRMLAAQGVRIRVTAPEALPVSPAGYRGVAAVILDDVPAIWLSAAQMAALRDYVGRLGGGLLAVGGPHSFGAGGYAGTPLEEALPVTMDVRHRLAIPSMAIVLVIDTSGSMGSFGTQLAKVELAKETAQSVIDLLGERDIIGVISFDQEPRWLVAPTQARNRDRVMDQVSRVQAGGGTNMHPALGLAYEYLRTSAAKVRHVIVLSDGQTDPGDFQGLLTRMASEKITVSSVAIGADADENLMRNVARWGGGRYYAARDLYSIPQILTAEALIASRAYIVEARFTPQVSRAGLVDDLALPPLRGYVATAPKPAAAVHLLSPQDDPVLAAWQYGVGRAVAFTSDATARWGAAWISWTDVGRFWSRLVRWAGQGEADDLQVTVDRHADAAVVIADVVAADGTPQDGLTAQATLSGPAGAQVPLVETAPGRYEGSFRHVTPGAYAVTVVAQDAHGRERVRTSGFVVPYSPELRDLTVNRPLLARLAEATGGRFLDDPQSAVAPVRASRAAADAWPALAGTALGVFVAEIAVRRLPAISQHLAALAGAVRARVARAPSAAEIEEERQYAEADRWKFVEPDAAASESMEQAARLYIARLRAAQGEAGRKHGGADPPTPAAPARGGSRTREPD